MGSKIEAKRTMKEAGVPILEVPEQPAPGDFPVLIKASAGGGGRGMRIVRRAEDLDAEIAAAEAEAASAFGDGTVFVEPYVERSRHVEVQVVGDGHGDVLVLGERDCTVQRRHQKVVEEAPAASVPAEVAAALHEAARTAAAAIAYRGAGTVEFLYDPDTERFFFLEMNTRLQVEHPVTELVHGVDLVELQLAVAEGGGAGGRRAGQRSGGHAIEVRLYAEDASWTPQSGRLVRSTSRATRSSGRWPEPASGSTPASSPATRSPPTTTPCWPRSSPGRRTATRRSVSWWRRCVAPASTGS